MSFLDYLGSKAIALCMGAIGILYLTLIVWLCGLPLSLMLILCVSGVIMLLGCMIFSWRLADRRLRMLKSKLEATMPETYLIEETLPRPRDAVERQYYLLMKEISRSAIGAVEQARAEKQDYCDYVESWVHEIKTPLTACSLILSNGGNPSKLRRELRRADNLMETILTYSKLQTVEKGTQISLTDLRTVCDQAVREEMELLIAAGISVAIVMSNVAFSEKIYTDLTIEKECPYDVMALFDLSEEPGISMNEGRKTIEKYSSITGEQEFQLYSLGDIALSSSIIGYDLMGRTDLFMPLSQFNQLLTGCGYDPVSLENEYLLATDVQGICDIDFSGKPVTLNGETYTWGGSSLAYPDFARRPFFYFVVSDEAVEGLPTAYLGAAYTLENHRPDAEALMNDLTWVEDGSMEERCWYAVQEYIRLYSKANAGTLIIGALYGSTVFVCMALAILSVKTLSALEEERRRFAILYRLGADEKMQRAALLRQTGAFFLMPFAFPLLITVPVGVIFGKVYELWNLTGLRGGKAMENALLIALVIAGIYALYFVITYRIACSHVLCSGGEKQENFS